MPQTDQPCSKVGGAERPDCPSDVSTSLDWIQKTISASERDVRQQPWKKHFANTVESRLDGDSDLVTIKKSVDESFDSSCPFQIQGSSLAA